MMKTKQWQEFRRFIEAQPNILSQNELVITTIKCYLLHLKQFLKNSKQHTLEK